MTTKEKFFQRIDYSGKLENISLTIIKDFKLGNFLSDKLVTVGYEDFNYILSTTRSKYFVKIFSNHRTDDECKRCVDILLRTIKKGVSMPKLIKSNEGYLYKTKIGNSKLRLCVMEYVDGKDFFSLKYKPTSDEIKFLAHQSALINSVKIKPSYVYDSWAVPNFLKEFRKKSKYLKKEDFEMLAPLVKEFNNISISKLPHCFVHGDILMTNTMKDKKGNLWIIDFSVSNYYPRIQEIAVLACDIIFDDKSRIVSDKNLKLVLDEYQKTIKLRDRELEALPSYIRLAHAMHILLANYEKIVKKNNSKENEYFLKRGRIGLRQ